MTEPPGCETLTLFADSEKKKIQAFETECMRKCLCIPYLKQKTNDWVRSKINFLVGPQEPLLASQRDPNLHGSGTSHDTTASRKSSFKAPWRVGDAVVGRGNGGWTTPKSGHPCTCQNRSQEPPAKTNKQTNNLEEDLC